MPDNWSREEVEAAVSDYFSMLAKELRGEAFNKAEHNRALQLLLDNRPRGSVERKHQNISAVLIEAGYPYIEGYKPLSNYQELLRTVVLERLAGATALNTTVAAAVEQPATEIPHIRDLLAMQVDPPTREERGSRVKEELHVNIAPVRRNYLEMEARNRSLGRAGEELALRFERERLMRIGKPMLASRIQHVSQTEGDHLGYDIRSFDSGGRRGRHRLRSRGKGFPP